MQKVSEGRNPAAGCNPESPHKPALRPTPASPLQSLPGSPPWAWRWEVPSGRLATPEPPNNEQNILKQCRVLPEPRATSRPPGKAPQGSPAATQRNTTGLSRGKVASVHSRSHLKCSARRTDTEEPSGPHGNPGTPFPAGGTRAKRTPVNAGGGDGATLTLPGHPCSVMSSSHRKVHAVQRASTGSDEGFIFQSAE